MNEPKVYIIILNYNGWKDTIECLESVLKLDYTNYQVVVVDNCSINNSLDYIKAWARGDLEISTPEESHPLYRLSHPPIKKPIPYVCYTKEEAERGGGIDRENKVMKRWYESYGYSLECNNCILYPLVFVQTGCNLGFAGGNNVGVKYALKKGDCDYVWLLNNDTVVEKNSLSVLVSIFLERKGTFLLSSRIHHYNEVGRVWFFYPVFFRWIGLVLDKYYLRKRYTKMADENARILEVEFLTGCAIIVPKRAFTDIGFLDEEIFLYHEDLDYSLRAIFRGYKLLVYDDVLVYHKIERTSKESCFSYFWNERSLGYVYRKHRALRCFVLSTILFQFLVRIPVRFIRRRVCLWSMYRGWFCGWFGKLC